MLISNKKYFIVSLTEWLNWIAYGYFILKNDTDISFLHLTDDSFTNFIYLMYNAPHEKYNDDGSFIISQLKLNFIDYITKLPDSDYLNVPLLCVEAFYPVSDRGSRLLSGDAKRANVVLGPPIFETLWQHWLKEQTKFKAQFRGKKFAQALSLVSPYLQIFESLPKPILPFLLGEEQLPNSNKTSSLEATRAMAWARAFSMLTILLGDQIKEKLKKILDINDLIIKLKIDDNLDKPILYNSDFNIEVNNISKFLLNIGFINISFNFLLFIFYYLHILQIEKEISLDSLNKDLYILFQNNEYFMLSNALYFIGYNLTDDFVNSLYYKLYFDDFPFIYNKDLGINFYIRNLLINQYNSELNNVLDLNSTYIFNNNYKIIIDSNLNKVSGLLEPNFKNRVQNLSKAKSSTKKIRKNRV
jgi:hypothetical protein